MSTVFDPNTGKHPLVQSLPAVLRAVMCPKKARLCKGGRGNIFFFSHTANTTSSPLFYLPNQKKVVVVISRCMMSWPPAYFNATPQTAQIVEHCVMQK